MTSPLTHPPDNPAGGHTSIDPSSFPPSLSFSFPFFFLFSFSSQARQKGINRKSRKRLGNKLLVKRYRVNFYFKGNFWNDGKRGEKKDAPACERNFDALACWCGAANWGEEWVTLGNAGAQWGLEVKNTTDGCDKWMVLLGKRNLTEPVWRGY